MPDRKVTLGPSDIRIMPIGLGCMGMSQSYGDGDAAESVRTIHEAVDLGVDMFDTADIYGAADAARGRPILGFGHNEELLGEALMGRRDGVLIATKFAARLTDDGKFAIDGRPEYVAQACEASLRRLRTDRIDLYYYHRVDRRVPIEETVQAMAGMVAAGKVRAIGLSEVDVATLGRAVAEHPIAALQSEYSLWDRRVEAEILPACQKLRVTLVPYSPLGRAMLTGTISDNNFSSSDFRSTLPKFDGDNFAHNLRLVEALRAFSETKGCTPAQVSLAWLLHQPFEVTPIPGTKRVSYLRENVGARDVVLTAQEVDLLSRTFAPDLVKGEQYGTR